YVQQLILQIRNQKYKNYEVILIDDGSTDYTKKLISKYIRDLNNFFLIVTENQGAANARNLGIKYARGEYIYFLDADDVIAEELLSVVTKQISEDQSELLIFGYIAKNEKNRALYDGNFKENRLLKDNDEFFEYVNQYFFSNNLFCSWNKIYRRKFLLNKNLTFPSVGSSEDALFNICVFKEVSRVSICNQKLYEYLVGRAYSLQSFKTYQKVSEDLYVCEQLNQLKREKKLEERNYKNYLIAILFKHFGYQSKLSIKREEEISCLIKNITIFKLSYKNKLKLIILKLKRRISLT
ncbi:glycosyltransferase family 2 protein, partial [Enterococcus faecalis]|nr:glycosyltransferase family 2 protein [Enterococcus faecalis]